MQTHKTNIDLKISSENSLPNVILDRFTQDYYYQEVMQGLKKIESYLSKLQKEPGNREYVQQIRNIAEYVTDLAMIHGYEGVENIAEKIRSSSDLILCKSEELEKPFLSKIEFAVKAIRQVMELEEDIDYQLIFDEIDEKIALKQKEVRSCASRLSNYFEQSKQKNKHLFFDIREINTLMNLVEEPPRIKSGNKPNNLNDTKFINNLKKNTKNSAINFTRPIASAEISKNNLTAVAKEQLSVIEQAVLELQVIPYATHAIQDIYTACKTLQETALRLNDKNLTLILNPIQKLTQDKLNKTKPVSDSILEIFNQTTKLIHNHIDYNQDDIKEIQNLGQKIEKILKVESVSLKGKEMDTGHFAKDMEDGYEKKGVHRSKIGSFLRGLIKNKK
ncbi:MAG: hypothetical protein ACE5JB_06945 [bacterium]